MIEPRKIRRACFQNNITQCAYIKKGADLVFQRFTGRCSMLIWWIQNTLFFFSLLSRAARARVLTFIQRHVYASMMHSPTSVCHSGGGGGGANFNPWKAISSACIYYVKQIKKKDIHSIYRGPECRLKTQNKPFVYTYVCAIRFTKATAKNKQGR